MPTGKAIRIFATAVLAALISFGAQAATDWRVSASANANYSPGVGGGPLLGDTDSDAQTNGVRNTGATAVAGPATNGALNGASVGVSLDSGTIFATAFATSLGEGIAEQGSANFSGEFRDHITFDLPDGMDSATVTARWAIVGKMSAATAAATGEFLANWSVTGNLTLGGANDSGLLFSQPDLLADFAFAREATITVTDGQRVFLRAGLSSSLTALEGTIGVDLGGVPITGGALALLAENTLGGGLSFDLPEGVSFTSDSGAALTAVPIPPMLVPFGLMLIGLAGRPYARRKIGESN